MAIVACFLASSLLNLAIQLFADDVHRVLLGLQGSITVVTLAAAWWWLRELRRSRRGE
ncbi:MAG: hypothetical protein M3507_10785 [Actinomycetota bacterium]|nr:hypothetical protein [Actinomycetota bacterium]